MKTLNVHIWYDHQGKILAVGRAPMRSNSTRQRQIIPELLNGQHHLQADVAEEAVAKLHETYQVDVKEKTLVRKGDIS